MFLKSLIVKLMLFGEPDCKNNALNALGGLDCKIDSFEKFGCEIDALWRAYDCKIDGWTWW